LLFSEEQNWIGYFLIENITSNKKNNSPLDQERIGLNEGEEKFDGAIR
jgi:hypothetical protein